MATSWRLRLKQKPAVQRRFPSYAAVRAVGLILLFNWLISGAAAAQSDAPIALVPENFPWRRLPDNPALESAWVLGDSQQARPYILRVKLAAGGRIPPHTHPDERNNTVLQGVVYIGFGETFDESKVAAIPTGVVCVIPADVPHYVWARDGDVIYQEAGVDVTGTTFIGGASPP